MTKITHRTNLTIVVKVVDLDTSRIYSPNHMVGMDKISSNEACKAKMFRNEANLLCSISTLKICGFIMQTI